ncbi:hypothetical protein CFOL_v3_31223 [Cephalotus follicularis]|uniref:Uncharacterized protein n=1 Tax=Cephalotus follicularis TaxID=3775 RepID=A0A1Q3D5N0_CEPFO|nr:hypothetical protein CFOL_v3_31223 [Cephalotus follicularis]
MFTHSLAKKTPKDLSKLLGRAKKYINAEETIAAKNLTDKMKMGKRKEKHGYGRHEDNNGDGKRKNRSPRRQDRSDLGIDRSLKGSTKPYSPTFERYTRSMPRRAKF